MKSVNALIAQLFTDPPTTNARGNNIRRACLRTNRMVIDFAEGFATDGWEQFDTDQDAPYFGVWMNKGQHQTLTYAEGDWTLVTCPDWDHYRAEVENAIQFYGVPALVTTYRQERQRFLEPI